MTHSLSTQHGEVPPVTMSRFIVSSEDDPACGTDFTFRRYQIDLKTYDTTAVRLAYDMFSKTMADVPALSNSLFVVEQYSVQGVQAIVPDSTAFAQRADTFLMYVDQDHLTVH